MRKSYTIIVLKSYYYFISKYSTSPFSQESLHINSAAHLRPLLQGRVISWRRPRSAQQHPEQGQDDARGHEACYN